MARFSVKIQMVGGDQKESCEIHVPDDVRACDILDSFRIHAYKIWDESDTLESHPL